MHVKPVKYTGVTNVKFTRQWKFTLGLTVETGVMSILKIKFVFARSILLVERLLSPGHENRSFVIKANESMGKNCFMPVSFVSR